MRSLVDELWAPGGLSAAGIGPDEDALPRAPSKGSRARRSSRHDQGRRRRRRRAHGGDDLRRRRGRGGHGADGSRRPVARHAARGGARGRRRRRRLHDPGPGRRQRASSRRTRACTSSSAPPAGARTTLREAVAGAPGNVFAAPNFAIGAVLMMRFATEASKLMAGRGDHRVPPPGEARRAVGHGRPHRGADGRRPADPLGPPAGPRRRPGRDLRRRRADAHHPPRDDRPHELHARRPARGPPRGRAARVPGVRARAAPVALVAVTDHAVERYLQRVRGALDPRAEIISRVSKAVDAGRVEPGERGARARPRPRARGPRLRLHRGPPARRAGRRDAVGGRRGPARCRSGSPTCCADVDDA